MRQNSGWLICIACVALAFAGCARPTDGADGEDGGRGRGAGGGTELATEAEIQAVEAQLISKEGFFGAIEASGVIRGIQEVTIIAETSGAVDSVRVRLGEPVSRGQVLVTLDNSLERFAAEQATDQLAVAEIEFAAVESLYASGNSSEAELARAKATVSGNRSALAQARRQLGNRIITSPVDGRVAIISPSISTGNFIQPGTAVVTVVNLERLHIDIGLGEREIQMVSVGDPARVYADACGVDPQGAVVGALAAGTEAQSGSFIVNIDFPNRCGPRLKSGMTARVEIADDNQAQNIVIPARALLREETGGYSVFVGQPDGDAYFAQRRPIEITRVLGDRAEVGAGLSENEILILAPLQTLEDGTRVNPTTIRG